jgi:hypothetical protein
MCPPLLGATAFKHVAFILRNGTMDEIGIAHWHGCACGEAAEGDAPGYE